MVYLITYRHQSLSTTTTEATSLQRAFKSSLISLSSKEKWLFQKSNLLGGALCLLIGYLVFIRKRTNNSNQDKHRTKKIKAQLKQAIKSNDHKSFIKWAYIYLDTVTKSNNINLLTKELSREENSATSSLFESVFSPVSSDKQTDRLSKSYLKALNKNSKVITKPKTPNINPKG